MMTTATPRSWLLLVSTGLSVSSAFLNGFENPFFKAFQPFTDLKPNAEALQGQVLKIRLDIGSNNQKATNHQQARLGITNLELQLEDLLPTGKQQGKQQQEHVKMPGFNGPHPKTSAGVGLCSVLEPGHVVDMFGTTSLPVNTATAAWELIWRGDAPAGVLICGLELNAPVQRSGHNKNQDNDAAATLKQGRLYLSFPVWKQGGLQEYQTRKVDTQKMATRFLNDRNEELAKMEQTPNLLSKAMHYRNAAQAVEQWSLVPKYSEVPDECDVFQIQTNSHGSTSPSEGKVWLTRTGTVWTKGGAFDGKQVLLGTATVALSSHKEETEEEENQPVRRHVRPHEQPHRLSKYMEPH